jgi:hypothetical protein
MNMDGKSFSAMLHMKNYVQVEIVQTNFGLLYSSFQLAVPFQAYLEPCETDPSLLMCYLRGLATGEAITFIVFVSQRDPAGYALH